MRKRHFRCHSSVTMASTGIYRPWSLWYYSITSLCEADCHSSYGITSLVTSLNIRWRHFANKEIKIYLLKFIYFCKLNVYLFGTGMGWCITMNILHGFLQILKSTTGNTIKYAPTERAVWASIMQCSWSTSIGLPENIVSGWTGDLTERFWNLCKKAHQLVGPC